MRCLLSRATLLFAALMVAGSAAHAQSVDEIIAKNIAAKGGAAVLKSTTSVRTTGKGTMQGQEVNVTSITKRPYFVRNEMEMAGQKIVQGFDGEALWMVMGTMPAQALPPGPQTEAMKQTSQIDSPLLDYQARGTKIELGEPRTEEGRKLHHLVVTPKTGPPMHYYIDPATGLESAMAIEVEQNGQTARMEMRFSDYKTVEGRTVPFTVRQFMNGSQMGQMKYENVEFNVPLDDAIFRMPK
jgi:outer membrane lipoprotein-sorting protein